MAEKLRRVERFEELRAGMVVVISPCLWCVNKHRGILTRRETGRSVSPDGGAWHGARFLFLPEVHEDDQSLSLSVTALGVAQGRIFIVEDGLEDTKTTEATKRLERVE